MEYVHLVILLGLVEYIFFVAQVGVARGKYEVPAPGMSGNEDFERVLRVQLNTHEQLILFIPGMLGFAHYVSPMWAAIIGSVYLVGRILYFIGYRQAAEKRAVGAGMSLLPNMILVVGAVIGLIVSLVS